MDFSDFRKEYARKYRTPEEAVEVVKSGDWVDYTSNVGFPYLLDRALANRKEELHDVKIRATSVSDRFRQWNVTRSVSISSIIPGTAAPMSASSVTGACATTSP